jgi:hypothetical protein
LDRARVFLFSIADLGQNLGQFGIWYGWLVLLAHRLAILTHVDQPGTVQWPLIAKEIVFGALKAEPKPDVVAGDATADTTVPVAIVPDEKGPKP